MDKACMKEGKAVKTDSIRETDIAAWIEGRLGEARRQEVEKLLAADPGLFDEFVALQRLLQMPVDASGLTAPGELVNEARSTYPGSGGLVDVVLGIVDNALRVLSHGAGVRLSFPELSCAIRAAVMVPAGLVVIRKSFDEVDVELDVERTGEGSCTIRVLMPSDPAVPYDHMRAELISEGRVIASELLPGGKGTFESIGPGRYRVVFRKSQRNIGDITIKFTESAGV